tara:strand:+ start:2385 stop:3215 length:831 start_codon:yes stop_codon:yes gene_type:complete
MIKCAITGYSGVLGKKILKKLPFKFIFFKGNISKFQEVEDWVLKNDFQVLIHLAAIVPTSLVKRKYKKAYNVNVSGTKNLINALLKKKSCNIWFFFSSSSHVYKVSNSMRKIEEEEKPSPSSLYGKTKLMAEKALLKKLNNHKKIRLCIGRIFSFTDKTQKKPYVIPSILSKIKFSKSKIVNLKNTNHYRDFISTKDISTAIYKLYLKKRSGIFNIGLGKKINLKDIAVLIGNKYNKKVKFSNNSKITYLISNNKKIKKYLPKKTTDPVKEILSNI